MMTRTPALLTLVLTEDGGVEVEPGVSFDDRHCELLVAALKSLKSVLSSDAYLPADGESSSRTAPESLL